MINAEIINKKIAEAEKEIQLLQLKNIAITWGICPCCGEKLNQITKKKTFNFLFLFPISYSKKTNDYKCESCGEVCQYDCPEYNDSD